MADPPCITLTVGLDEVKAEAGDDVAATKFRLGPMQARVVDVFLDQLREDRLTQLKEVQVLGAILYQALINGPVEELFHREIQKFRRRGSNGALPNERLTLELVLRDEQLSPLPDVPEKLTDVPWEFVYGADTPNGRPLFLSTSRDLALRRSVAVSEDWAELDELRVLIVTSLPPDLVALTGADPAGPNEVVKALCGLSESSRMRCADVLENPTMDQLKAALNDQDHPRDVLHLIGYGSGADGGSIALCANGGAELVPHSDFANALQYALCRPRLVFLHLLPGPRSGEVGNTLARADFAALAYELSRIPIQAVIGMRYAMPPESDLFTVKFYETMLGQGSVASAAQEGRFSVLDRGAMVGKAVLYSSADRLMSVPITAEPTDPNRGSSSQASAGQRPARPKEAPAVDAPQAQGVKNPLAEQTGEPVRRYGDLGW